MYLCCTSARLCLLQRTVGRQKGPSPCFSHWKLIDLNSVPKIEIGLRTKRTIKYVHLRRLQYQSPSPFTVIFVLLFALSNGRFVAKHRIPNGAPGGGVSGGNNNPGYWEESRTIIEPPREPEKIKRNKPELTEVADMLHNVRPPCEYIASMTRCSIHTFFVVIEPLCYFVALRFSKKCPTRAY